MAKKKKNQTLPKNKKKLKIIHSLYLISPFYFSKDHSFIYDIKIYDKFKLFCKTFNDYKLSFKENLYLQTNIDNIKKSFFLLDQKYNNEEVTGFFK
jgi:hypothetical protein